MAIAQRAVAIFLLRVRLPLGHKKLMATESGFSVAISLDC